MPTRRVTILCLAAAVIGAGGSALLLGRQARSAAREVHALRGEVSILIEARDGLLRQLSDSKDELDRTVASLRKSETELDAAKRANIDLAAKLTGYSEELVRKQSEARRQTETQKRLQELLQRELADHRVTITRQGSSLSLNLEGSVLFESGQASLSPDGTEVMRRVGEVLKQADGRDIRVIGHTDNRAVSQSRRGAYPTNWELSAVRATTVVRFLVDTVGLAPERCEAAGVAEFRPVADNGTAEGRARNRRIEILLIATPAPDPAPDTAPAEGAEADPASLTRPPPLPPGTFSSPADGTPSAPPDPAAAR